ncbi:VTC domain-containing protein [Mobilisporobacter senegalensis]|uniref:VTC domain-containing protein n=1 Tax=Mobilisporobacter senegalensis TaxID=1329262 RepID=A0A3N1XQN9_9FIRM|nr:polyphosphate polymerase domain-containing protein [Mobilisporobacter senegalensis]ROR28471.1 VTC domain-containing protein [Mobilisporobacter senegalensis]
MGQPQGTFRRYEKKYLLNGKNYKILRQRLIDKCHVDQYGRIKICNIYFDTPEHLLIRSSLEKPVYKEKLRLRSYGIPEEEDKVFVELKKKYKGIVYKRRVGMELSEAERYLYYLEYMNDDSQIINELNWFLKFYKEIRPAMYISYDRVALYGAENPELRITFDSNILWREEDLWLEHGSWGNSLLNEDEHLMEIKIPGAFPVWLSHILDELEIYPVSFSKYGRAYTKVELLKQKEREEGVIKYA